MINDSEEQRSLDWHRARLGCITGSRCADLMGKGRGKDAEWSQTALTYIYQLAAERIFNPDFLSDDDVFGDYINLNNHTTKAMQWGIEQEDAAKRLFMDVQFPDGDGELAEVSSCKHDTIAHFAASPDGIVLDRKTNEQCVLEIKCPAMATFMKYKDTICDAPSLKTTEPKYYWQVMAEMACTGAKTAYFVTYNPWVTEPIHIVRIERDDEAIAELEEKVCKANGVIDLILNKTE